MPVSSYFRMNDQEKIQVAITQEVNTIKNSLIFANNKLGAVVFIFIAMFSLLFMQDGDFVWKTFLLLVFIKILIDLNMKTPIEGCSFSIGISSL